MEDNRSIQFRTEYWDWGLVFQRLLLDGVDVEGWLVVETSCDLVNRGHSLTWGVDDAMQARVRDNATAKTKFRSYIGGVFADIPRLRVNEAVSSYSVRRAENIGTFEYKAHIDDIPGLMR
jgi:hypothetical protein